MTDQNRPVFKAKVVVIIKALNEERFIEKSIESALLAVENLNGLVVLADSGSTDKTIQIATNYPIKIVQLKNLSERSCGLGAQLGYQYIDSDYLYILDGDMEITPHFLVKAIELLDKDPSLAAVAGLVEELGGGNYEFESRKSKGDGQITGKQNALDMGGLYRTSAIKEIGYLTNKNLHSYEEKELGYRLTSKGYSLIRIDIPAIKHYGKTEESLKLLIKRWNSFHIDGPGEWLHSLLFSRNFFNVSIEFKQLFAVAFGWVLLIFGLLLIACSTQLFLFAFLMQIILFIWLFLKKKSLSLAVLGYIHLQVYTAGMIRGLFRSQKKPDAWIDSLIVKN